MVFDRCLTLQTNFSLIHVICQTAYIIFNIQFRKGVMNTDDIFRCIFAELLDAVVLQERPHSLLGREPEADHHLQYRRGLLGTLQSHRAMLQTHIGLRLQPLQGGHQAHVGGRPKPARRQVRVTYMHVELHFLLIIKHISGGSSTWTKSRGWGAWTTSGWR